MIFGMPQSELIELTLALGAGGAVSGFVAGLLGLGGGGVIVPIFYEIFRAVGVDDSVRMQVCVATSLAIIVPTSIRAFRSHSSRNSVDGSVIRSLGPWVCAGAALGVLIAAQAPAQLLKALIAASALFMATRMAFASNSPSTEGKLPGFPWDALAGAGIGLISTLIGIGGGAYVTAYMRLFGRPIHLAVGTAAGFGPLIAIPAVLGYVAAGWHSALVPLGSLGFVSVLGFAIVAPITVLTAPFGVRVAHRLSPRDLQYAFVAFLLSVATRFLAGVIFNF